MDWILGHLPIVIALATFVAGWVSQQRKKSAEASSSEPGSTRRSKTLPPPLVPPVPADEQIRRIQEEVRRKIQERLSGPKTGQSESPFRPSTPAPTPTLKPRSIPAQRRPVAPAKEAPQPFAKPTILTSSLEEQERENARRKEDRRREARKADREVAQAAEATRAVKSGGSPVWLTSEVQNPASLRRAFVLAEVLGPPVSMRR